MRLYMDGETADGVPDVEERQPSEPEVSPPARRHFSRPTRPTDSTRSHESSAKPPAAAGSAILERPRPRMLHRARPLRLTYQGGWALAVVSVAMFVGWLVAHV
jgi:hypothetical protein